MLDGLLVAGLQAAAFGTNCWVLATGPGERCVVVDPGIGVVPGLAELLVEHRLRPAAVVLTHGHIDHVFSVRPVCGAHDVPAYLAPEDDWMLADPFSAISPQSREAFAAAGLEWTEPEDVRPLVDGATLEIAGLTLALTAAPGHTAGSVLVSTTTAHGAPVTLSGDVLFRGSIGRTDLPGGNFRAMTRTLRDQVLTLPDETFVLPGHGPTTTIGAERAANPWLRDLHEPTDPDATGAT